MQGHVRHNLFHVHVVDPAKRGFVRRYAGIKSPFERDLKRLVQTEATMMYYVDTDMALTSRSFCSQIPVFHFPGVIERVIRCVPNQEPERPFRHLAGQLAL
jgi:hypothetical protein